MSYNMGFNPIDHYKKTVAIPLFDSLIIQLEDLCVVPSIIVNKALQLDDEVEGMLFWEKSLEN